MTPEEVVRIAASHGLQIDPTSLEITQPGLDFHVAFARDLSGGEWVLRFPRRADVMAGAHREKQALDVIRPQLPFEVPDWRISSDDLIAYPKLSGFPAAVLNMEEKRFIWRIDEKSPPAAYLESLAEALVAMHRVRGGLTFVDPRADLPPLVEAAKSRLKVPEEVLARWNRWLADDTYWPSDHALIHGDLHPGHTLIDEDARITGIIDWTEAQIGDPSVDFGMVLTIFGAEHLDTLIDLYAGKGGKTWPRMKEHIIELAFAYPLTVVRFAMRTGSDEHFGWAQGMIDGAQA